MLATSPSSLMLPTDQMVNERCQPQVDSGCACVDRYHSRGQYYVHHLESDGSAFQRPLLLCVPTSLTYVWDACLFIIQLAVLPALSKVPFISPSFLASLNSLTRFAIVAGIALFPGIINPHDIGYFYVIQYLKFSFVCWGYIGSIYPYISFPESTPIQSHIISPFVKIILVLSYTICTQSMYSQLLKHHKIPPHERKSYRVFETILTEVKFIYGVILECFGYLLCKIERCIRRVVMQQVVLMTSDEALSDEKHHWTRMKFLVKSIEVGASLTSMLRKLLNKVELDARQQASGIDLPPQFVEVSPSKNSGVNKDKQE